MANIYTNDDENEQVELGKLYDLIDFEMPLQFEFNYDYRGVTQAIKQIKDFCKFLSDQNLAIMDQTRATELTYQTKNLIGCITEYNKSLTLPPSERNKKEAVHKRFEDLVNTMVFYISNIPAYISNYTISAWADLRSESGLITRLTEDKNEIASIKTEIEGLFQKAQATTGAFVVEKYSSIFSNEATKNSTNAGYWFGGALLLSLVIIGTAFKNVEFFEEYLVVTTAVEWNNTALVYIGLSKIVVLTTLFYGLSICVKNYRWNKHNETVNTHRQNALSSFEAYLTSFSPDDVTKNLILLEVAKTIFGSQQTGFVDKDGDDSPYKLIEILKPLGGGAK